MFFIVVSQVQGVLHSFLTSAEVQKALGKFSKVLHGDAECWNQNPLLDKLPPGNPTVDFLPPPPPSSPELEMAFGGIGAVFEATLDKLNGSVLGMLEEFDEDCHRIEVISNVHMTDS